MEELPKIVVERLATATPGEHPEANLLAAFSENSLTAGERGEVLRHLAVCDACREITSLVLPQQEENFAAVELVAAAGRSTPRAASSRQRFNLRWVALAACGVMVAGLVWFEGRPPEKAATVLPAGTISSKGSNQQVARLTEEAAPLSYKAKQKAPPEQADVARAANMQARSPDEVRIPSRESLRANAGSAYVAEAPPLPPEKAPGISNGEAHEMALPAAPASEARTRSVGAETSATGLARQQVEVPREEKDKKAVATAGAVFSGTLADTTLAATRLDAFVRFTLSDGQLRRSTDGGLSWEIVPISQDAKFRALSVVGQELWVGGKNGMLYHSSDYGTNWVHVIPSAGDLTLTEDIVRLEFADTKRGKLITPHSEWSTTNCGATWRRKQPR
jgi:hypothetical protein